jgi:hypothetical protein
MQDEDEEQGVKLDAHGKAHLTVSKSSAINWPFPVDGRLDQLVDLANESGAGTRRNELAAAIVASVLPDPDTLLELVLAWRRAKVWNVLLNETEDANVVYLPRYGPGRRRLAR